MLMNMENETCRDEQKNKVQSKVMLILLSAHCRIQHMSLLCCIVVYIYTKKEISAFMSLSYMYIKEFLWISDYEEHFQIKS